LLPEEVMSMEYQETERRDARAGHAGRGKVMVKVIWNRDGVCHLDHLRSDYLQRYGQSLRKKVGTVTAQSLAIPCLKGQGEEAIMGKQRGCWCTVAAFCGGTQ
jgi:hypothetical protein